MGVILDSSVLIEAERGGIDLASLLAELGDEDLAISAVTASELLHGVHRAKSVRQKSKRERFVEWALSELEVCEFGLAEARVHALLWAHLSSRGQLIGAHDLLIAATALSRDWRLATSNRRDFDRVSDLELLDWSSDQ